jgi:hypothetical protein
MTDDKSLDKILDKFFILRQATPDIDLNEIKIRNEIGEPKIELKQALEAHINQVRDTVTRVELIDEDGRTVLVSPGEKKVTLSFQDDNRTLKIFVDELTQGKP